VTRVTVAARTLGQCARTSDGWSALACMEKIMSKSNDSSKLVRTPQVRELRDDELENVSGGLININTADEAQLTSIVVTKPTDVASMIR